MISRLVRYFSGRVGRRLFFLFVLSAFLPMAAFAVLSFNQSRDLLLKQGEQRLAATAKAFGMSLFERLQLLSDLAAASAGPDASRPAEGSLARSSFTSLARVRRDGTVAAIFGEPRVTRLGDAQRKRLAEGHPTLTVLPAAQGSLLVLAVPVNAGGEIAALAELAPGAFWQPEALPAATEFCVVDEDARTQLFCSAPMPEAALLADSREPRTAFGVSRWKRGDDAYLSASWSQYMRFAFGTADWVVVASQPEGFILARLLDYQRVYIPVVVLALLLVSWFTIRQSRAIVEPVAQLAEGARRVARNDFSVPVTMDRGDEFGELASAFNQMSTRLGRQIAALTALSEIDRLILDTPDTVQVVRTVLARMGAVVPADFFGIALFNPGRAGHANAYFRDPEASEGVGVANVEVGPRDRELLVRNPNGTWILLEESDVGILRQLRERGMRTAYVQPIVWRESLCGALALGYREAASGGQEARQQAREFADRVAVAVSSAWRDEQLYQQAHFDALTELPNRLLLKDRLRQEIARSQREKSRFGVLFIDIDRFKDVNDSLGHSVGDSVLRESARRIVACVRESDTVSRLGGDEFAVLLTHVQQPQDTGRVAGNVVKELSRAFEFDGQQLFLSASIGVASFPEDGSTAEELLKNADTAMYRAKAGGRARVKYFEESMNTEAVARLTLDRDLRLAIDRGELEVHYQPLVDVRSGAIRGAEALMRWRHPERGEIAPVRFIPVAEESGLIERIGRFALEQACAQIKAWQREGLALQRISVNVSPRQLREPGVMAMVRECAREAGVGLDALELEITEGLLIEHAESVEGLLREMHDSGLRIALDDFGTGFSSMAYLTRFPIDTIKIDRVFVDGLGSSRDSRAIVEAVIVMGHALGKTVVAEGVETPGQLALLTELGCDEVQGYHFARPMPAGAFVEFARAHAASRSRGVAVAQKAIPG